MSFINEKFNNKWLYIVFVSFLLNLNVQAQKKISSVNPDTILLAAREIIASTKYCAFITVDSTGEAHARTMEVYKPENDFTIWFGTNAKSRKIREIQKNPNVTIYYEGAEGSGYLTVFGKAETVSSSKEISKYWNVKWANYFTDKKDFILIKVVPRKLEIISYSHELNGDKETWSAIVYEFKRSMNN